ncbi:MAG: type II secretion system protein GspN [Nitrospinae bacterium]|nr:type II secretion system protein GspN [Nitrospinota bacterium]
MKKAVELVMKLFRLALKAKPWRVTKTLADRPEMARFGGYFIFFVAAFLLFLYIRFPSEALLSLVDRATEGMPVKVKADEAALAPPLGVKLAGLTIYAPSPSGNQEILSATQAKLKFPVTSALTFRKGFCAYLETLDGAIDISGGQRLFERNMADVQIEMEGVNPALLPVLQKSTMGKVSGRLTGSGAFSFEGMDPMKGEGAMKLALDAGSVSLSKVLVADMGDIPLDSGVMEVSLKSGTLAVDRLELKSPMLEVSVLGEILLNPNPRFSRLNLKANLKFSGPLDEKLKPLLSFFPRNADGGVTVKITGTAEAPSIR